MNNRLLINGTSRNLNWFFNYFCFFLNTSENRFEFFFLNISFIDINFLIDCVFFWLDVSIILDFVSRNLNRFLNLLIRKLGWKHNRFSFNYFIFSVNEFRFSSNEFIQNGWLFNNLLSNREFNLFWNNFWFSGDSFGENFRRSSNSLFHDFWFFSNYLFLSNDLIFENFFFPSSLINITVGISGINLGLNRHV